MKKGKTTLFFVKLLLIIAIFPFNIYANSVDPNNPGNSPETAWAFNNVMDVTQIFSEQSRDHYYRLDVNSLDHTFQLTLNSPAGSQILINIFDSNTNLLRTIAANGGQHIENITLARGTFYLEVSNLSNASDQTYRMQMRPFIEGFLRSPNGDRVDVLNTRSIPIFSGSRIVGDLHINHNIARTFNYNVSWQTQQGVVISTHRVTATPADNFAVGTHIRVGRLTNYLGTFYNVVEVPVTNFYASSTNHGSPPVLISGQFVNFYYDIDSGLWIDSADSSFHNPTVSIGVRFTATDFYESMPSNPISVAKPPENLSIDFINETLAGGSSVMQYSLNGTSWTSFNSNNPSISSIIPAVGRDNATLYVRYRSTTMFLTSEHVELPLPARTIATPTTAEVRFDGFTESISVNDRMEYRIASGGWVDIPQGETRLPVALGTANVSYQVRAKGSETRFSSIPLNVTVPRRPAAPNAVYNANSDAITGVTTAMEYSLDGGTTWTRSTTTTIQRSVLGNEAITVNVRTAATATAAVSEVRVVNVPNDRSFNYIDHNYIYENTEEDDVKNGIYENTEEDDVENGIYENTEEDDVENDIYENTEEDDVENDIYENTEEDDVKNHIYKNTIEDDVENDIKEHMAINDIKEDAETTD